VVDRRTYFRRGAALVLLKYGGDAALIAIAIRRWWTPAHYLDSIYLLYNTFWTQAPAWLLPALMLWTLPFLWIGMRMTMERAEDAGLSPWFSLGFLLPYANYLLMLTLCMLPSARRDERGEPPVTRPTGDRLPNALLAIVISTIAGVIMIVISVQWLKQYGVGLFFFVPFAIGAIGSYLVNRGRDATIGQTAQVTFASLFLGSIVAVALAREGLICIIMAMPLLISVALLGAALGRSIARNRDEGPLPAVITLMVLPVAILLEPAHATGRMRHEVRSAIIIDAPADRIWPHIVAFRPIAEPTDLLSRAGIAYPRYVRIEGAGVGATRYCVFSTGTFVETVTVWEPGRRLTFDVTAAPPPLRELSPYRDVHPPHLDGYLRSRRGEFRLVPLPEGRTRLEGSSWYELEMAPEGYWQLFSDLLIHRIHRRVFDHIKSEVDADAQADGPRTFERAAAARLKASPSFGWGRSASLSGERR
jgi:hypothetical protein